MIETPFGLPGSRNFSVVAIAASKLTRQLLGSSSACSRLCSGQAGAIAVAEAHLEGLKCKK